MRDQAFVAIKEVMTARSKRLLASVGLLTVLALASPAFGQPDPKVSLGRLQSGAEVSFTRAESGEWGIEIAGGPAPRVAQAKPA